MCCIYYLNKYYAKINLIYTFYFLEVISRDSYSSVPENPLNVITSVEALVKFMKKEKELRKLEIKNCVSKHLDNLQWKKLYRFICTNLTDIKAIRNIKEKKLKFVLLKRKLIDVLYI